MVSIVYSTSKSLEEGIDNLYLCSRTSSKMWHGFHLVNNSSSFLETNQLLQLCMTKIANPSSNLESDTETLFESAHSPSLYSLVGLAT